MAQYAMSLDESLAVMVSRTAKHNFGPRDEVVKAAENNVHKRVKEIYAKHDIPMVVEDFYVGAIERSAPVVGTQWQHFKGFAPYLVISREAAEATGSVRNEYDGEVLAFFEGEIYRQDRAFRGKITLTPLLDQLVFYRSTDPAKPQCWARAVERWNDKVDGQLRFAPFIERDQHDPIPQGDGSNFFAIADELANEDA